MNNLPTIKELTSDLVSAQKQDALSVLLNQEPRPEWVRINKYANNAKYLPIERVEWLLAKIFKAYQIEVREVKQLFNGVSVTARVHYLNPIDGVWMFHDGVGAAQIQTKKGASPADLSNINNNAIALCVPIAKTEAVKNACKSFGKLFGSDLNRDGEISYELDASLIEMGVTNPRWQKLVESVKSGRYSVADIEAKYILTEEAKKSLQDIK